MNIGSILLQCMHGGLNGLNMAKAVLKLFVLMFVFVLIFNVREGVTRGVCYALHGYRVVLCFNKKSPS